MIYGVYLASIISPYYKQRGEFFAKALREAPEKDVFVAITAERQEKELQLFVDTYGLKDLIQFQMEQPITNNAHKDQGRRLKLHIFSKTKLTESDYVTGVNITGKAGLTVQPGSVLPSAG